MDDFTSPASWGGEFQSLRKRVEQLEKRLPPSGQQRSATGNLACDRLWVGGVFSLPNFSFQDVNWAGAVTSEAQGSALTLNGSGVSISKSGLYAVTAWATFEVPQGVTGGCSIQIVDTLSPAFDLLSSIPPMQGTTSALPRPAVSAVWYFPAGDDLAFRVFQDTGGSYDCDWVLGVQLIGPCNCLEPS